MTEIDVITALIGILPVIGGLLVSLKKYFDVSGKLTKIRTFVDTVDDALKDDEVTEAEFRKIFENYKNILN